MQPNQIPILVIDPVANAVVLPLFLQHRHHLFRMHLLIRPVDPLLQQGYEIGDQIALKAEILLQIVGYIVQVFLHIPKVQIYHGPLHGQGLD